MALFADYVRWQDEVQVPIPSSGLGQTPPPPPMPLAFFDPPPPSDLPPPPAFGSPPPVSMKATLAGHRSCNLEQGSLLDLPSTHGIGAPSTFEFSFPTSGLFSPLTSPPAATAYSHSTSSCWPSAPMMTPSPQAVPPPLPSLLPPPPPRWIAAHASLLSERRGIGNAPNFVTEEPRSGAEVIVKVAFGHIKFCLVANAIDLVRERGWDMFRAQLTNRLEICPGGGATVVAINSGCASITYCDADGDLVQLMCQADLAIAVRVASLNKPPTLRLVIRTDDGVVRSGEGSNGSGDGGDSDSGDSDIRDRGNSRSGEGDEHSLKPHLPLVPPDQSSSPTGPDGDMAVWRQYRSFRRPCADLAAMSEPRWECASAEVMAARIYSRGLLRAVRPPAADVGVPPVLSPPLPQLSEPLPQRSCRQRAPRIHERRRRGERWRSQCGLAPRMPDMRVGVGSCSAELRHVLQTYGEGPGRSRSGPISIR